MRDDNELMACAQNGDKKAYDELVIKHRVQAVSFAYSLLSDLQAAEDAVQDVFVKIYINRASYRPIYSFKTFLYRSVKNKCVDYMRLMKQKNHADFDAIADIAYRCLPEDVILRGEYVNAVFSIMNNLQKDYKTALYLCSVGDMSYSEIAPEKIMPNAVAELVRELAANKFTSYATGFYKGVILSEEDLDDIEGGQYGFSLTIRHNTLGNLQILQENIKMLIINRFAYTAVSLLLFFAVIRLYQLKREGQLDVIGSIKNAFGNQQSTT